jgi:hypothetical protein
VIARASTDDVGSDWSDVAAMRYSVHPVT